MSSAVFEIRFPAYTSGGQPRCSPKSTLAGVVYLHITQELKASCISLSFMGSERISLAPASVNNTWTQSFSAPAAKQRTAKKVYFNQSTVLWGDGKLRESGILPAGVHMFHFSCEFPRVNYPQSRATPEYEIKYVLKAKLMNPRQARESSLMTTAQTIAFLPETLAPLPRQLTAGNEECDPAARFAFCDNALDVDGSQWMYHLHAISPKHAFCPGEFVEMHLRMTGQRTLRKLQYAVVEQTDCFYPQVPEPREEQLDIGRRLWSTQRRICELTDLSFERDSVVATDFCAEHMDSRRSRSGSTYHAQLCTQLPTDALVVHETGYLRFTYFVQLLLSSSSVGWGGHQGRCARVEIPIPVASRVPPGNAATPSAPTSLQERRRSVVSSGGGRRRGPSISSSRTEVESLDFLHDCGGDDDTGSLKHGRSITDLSARLQQFIPRRHQSAAHTGLFHRLKSQTEGHQSNRAVSHGRVADGPPLWSMTDLPPMPAIGAYPSAHASQASLLSSSISRVASHGSMAHDMLTMPLLDQPYSNTSGQHTGVAANKTQQCKSASGTVTRFSLSFLVKLRELYYDEANALALTALINGHEADGNSLIPSVIRRPQAIDNLSSFAPRGSTGNRRGEYRSRDISLGIGGGTGNCNRRGNRMSMQSLSSMTAVNERVCPRLESVMASFRDPATSQVATWSALGSPARPQSMHYHPAQSSVQAAATTDVVIPASKTDCLVVSQQSRYSRMSAMSVSSNDTACAASGCMSLSKDMQPQLPSLFTPTTDSTLELKLNHPLH
ncbi:hypothetical protein H4S08_002667 [Coemansia sp. RSA 1365]|nr:hypothetical protein H4S08_002667 [Coemansia sp. RSA 1365]